MEINEIIKNLTHPKGGLPFEALNEAISKKDEITPHLLDILKYTNNNIDEILEDDDYFGHIYAMYLLAQFKEKKAYPLIVKLISNHESDVEYILEHLLREDLDRVLASVSNGDTTLIEQIAENTEIHELVRCAALDSFIFLYTNGVIPRSEVVEYYRSLLHGKLNKDDSNMFELVIDACLNIHPDELYNDIKKLYDDGTIEGKILCLDMDIIDEINNENKDQVINELKESQYNSLIEDAIVELENFEYSSIDHYIFDEPYLNPSPNLGRNDPCPCVSGKKHKKCCLE